MIARLARQNMMARKTRALLTIAAIAFSVSLVVSVTTGYASLKAGVYGFIARFIGSYDARIDLATERTDGLPLDLLERVRADRDVRRAVPRVEFDQVLVKPGRGIWDPRPTFCVGLDPQIDDAVQNLPLVEGRWFASRSALEIVIDQAVAERQELRLGERVQLPTPSRTIELQVVGIIHKPGIASLFIQTAYVPIETVKPLVFAGRTDRIGQIEIQFDTGVNSTAFLERWREGMKGVAPNARVELTRETREKLDRQLMGVDIMSYMGGAASMLAATFIVFSTLSMGVTERQRTLAMLRAVGGTRGQLARLVLAEGLSTAAVGVLVGVPLGIGFVHLLAGLFPTFFSEGVSVSVGGVAFASSVSMLSGLAASALPAWIASRVDPLEAMAPLARPAPAVPWRWAILGAALVGIDPLLTFGSLDSWLSAIGLESLAARHREIRFYGHFAIGLPGVLLGSFLLAPMLVWLLDLSVAPLIARVLRVPPRLLRQQLSGGLWRASGTAAALMVGLGILIVMQSQGRSGLSAWRLPTLFPDVFIYSTVGGIDEAGLKRIREMPGVVDGRTSIMPIAVFSPRYASNVFGLAGMAFMPDATTFIAVDPDRVFDLMGLEFRQGDADTAREMLRRGRHLLVTEELARLRRLGVGSPFELKNRDGEVVRYTVAGVIWSPGIEIMVAAFDLRKQFDQRSAASVFGTLEDARRDFGKRTFELVTVNLDPALRKFEFLHQLRNDLGGIGLAVADVRTLKREITRKLEQLLALGSTVAWSAMLVASLGVTNAVVAGVRTRRWQFGVLRSIGVTRSMLLRIVLAESLLLGVLGAVLGLFAGLLMAMNAWRFYDIVLGFRPPFTLPWDMIGLGTGMVVLVSLLASLLPAVTTARTDVLALLQGGRSAT